MEGIIAHMVTLRTFRREVINECFRADRISIRFLLVAELRKHPNVIGQLQPKIPRGLLPVSNPILRSFSISTEITWKLETQQSPRVQRPHYVLYFRHRRGEKRKRSTDGTLSLSPEWCEKEQKNTININICETRLWVSLLFTFSSLYALPLGILDSIFVINYVLKSILHDCHQ